MTVFATLGYEKTIADKNEGKLISLKASCAVGSATSSFFSCIKKSACSSKPRLISTLPFDNHLITDVKQEMLMIRIYLFTKSLEQASMDAFDFIVFKHLHHAFKHS